METLLAVLTSMMISYAPYNVNGVEFTKEEAFCLAQNVFMEAKGENLAGKSAVAHVTLNRVKHSKYPNSVCGVTKQAKLRTNWKGSQVPIIGMCQFSWYCDGKDDTIPRNARIGWKQAQEVALYTLVLNQYKGLVEGATHYHADYVKPDWRHHLTLIGKIDRHIFYRWD